MSLCQTICTLFYSTVILTLSGSNTPLTIFENSQEDNCPITATSILPRFSGKDRERRFWQPTKHPEGIFSEKFYVQKVNYIHLNPVRKGLVRFPENWRFSSAAYWLKGIADSDVKLSEILW
jgi:hypothetical protein